MNQSISSTGNGQQGAGAASQSTQTVVAQTEDAGKMLHLVSRASSDNDHDDVSLFIASLDKTAVILLLAAYQELLDGIDTVSYISIYLPFGMTAEFLQTDDELEERFAGDASVSEGRASEFTFEVVGQPLDDDKTLGLQPTWTLQYPTAQIWRDGEVIVHADFKHAGGSVTSATIPLEVFANHFGLTVPVATLPEDRQHIYVAHFDGASRSEIETIIFSSPDEKYAYFQAAIRRIILNHDFRSTPDEIGEMVKKAIKGETLVFNTVGRFTPEDFEKAFTTIKVKEVRPVPNELIYASYA